MVLIRHLAAAFAALATCAAVAPADGQAPPHTAMITCANTASGATWQISIDYDRATVDGNPAKVGEAEISWHDAKDGSNKTLDRRSGKLTVIMASSTGGYFIYDLCRLPP